MDNLHNRAESAAKGHFQGERRSRSTRGTVLKYLRASLLIFAYTELGFRKRCWFSGEVNGARCLAYEVAVLSLGTAL